MGTIRFKSSSSGSEPAGRIGKLFISLFFLFFAAMGTFFMYMIGAEVLKTAQTYAWSATPCVIRASAVADTDDDEDPYAFTVTYDYTFDGRPFTSSAFRRDDKRFSVYSDVQALIDRYPPGAEAECFVNPDAPAEAVLHRGGLWFGLFMLLPAVFMLVGFGGIWITWRGGDDDKEDSTTKSISSRADSKKGIVAAVLFVSLFIVIGLVAFIGHFVVPTL
ncbi:MAG: DUF3592 domain-containing protein, partial [Planctomycetota bacterium]